MQSRAKVLHILLFVHSYNYIIKVIHYRLMSLLPLLYHTISPKKA